MAADELDLRDLSPAKRHARVFEAFDALAPGETLVCVNDHDPKPLFYELRAEIPSFDADGYAVEREGEDRFVVTLPKRAPAATAGAKTDAEPTSYTESDTNMDADSETVGGDPDRRRVDYRTLAPAVYEAMLGFERHTDASTLDASLLELVKIRVSQLNGCAYCLDLHATEAREAGLSERRIAGVAAWHESPFYDDRERAALALAEALTRLNDGDPARTEAALVTVERRFTDEEFVDLVAAVVAINGWNRLWVAFRTPELPEA